LFDHRQVIAEPPSALGRYSGVMFSRRKFLQIAAASSGLGITGTDLLRQAAANASSTIRADGSRASATS
jgi:hypothetical protein